MKYITAILFTLLVLGAKAQNDTLIPPVDIESRYAGGKAAILKELMQDFEPGYITGVIKIKCYVDSTGKVVNAVIVQGINPKIDSTMLSTAKGLTFEPSTQPIAIATITYTLATTNKIQTDSIYNWAGVDSIPVPVDGNVDHNYRSSMIKECVGPNDTTGFMTAYLSVVIDKEGKPYNIQVERGITPCYDSDAVMIVSNMRFKPGLKGGIPVDVRGTIPVRMWVLGRIR